MVPNADTNLWLGVDSNGRVGYFPYSYGDLLARSIPPAEQVMT